MVVKNLEFFDKDGYNLNLNWNEKKQIWEGNIFFPRVSVGLYENTTIYVIEYDGYDSNYTDDIYTYPTGVGNISFRWDLANSFVDEFFMFDFDENYEIKDTSSLIHTPYDGPLCETLIINKFDKYVVPLLDSAEYIDKDDLLEIHVAFKADENSAETTYKRTLVISYENGYNKYEIARITFFAETIEEDERLKVWNENLGYNLKAEDSIIFKQSDIHEYMPNYELLNEKRKELMLEGNNIYPYIGSYKAILNVIKFFGYDNLNIVEYWRNINEYDEEFGNIYRTYVYSLKNKKTLSTKRKPISLNTKNFRKLNNISLVYNINHPEKVDGKKYDEYGLPNVIEDFDKNKRDDFRTTIEEVLIKLFALKKKLNNEFMPGSTKITDVIGEGNYFGINLIGNNPQISSVNYVESKGNIDFTVFPDKYCYITENEDFAKYIAEKLDINIDTSIENIGDKTLEDLIELYDGSDSDSDVSINELISKSPNNIISDLLANKNDSVCEYYEEYYDIINGNKFGDAKQYGLREIPEAKNVYEIITDDDSDSDIQNKFIPHTVICAKVVLKGQFDENVNGSSIIEWKITHPESGWNDIIYGDVKTYRNVFIQLPYLGNYDVEVSVWNIYNHCCKQYTKDAIIVKPYNIDIRGFYYDARPLPNGLKYDLMIPQEYIDTTEDKEEPIVQEYTYYLWYKYEDGIKKGVVTSKRNPMSMTISDVIGVYFIDNIVEYDCGLENIRNINEKESWTGIVNTESDGDSVLKFSWETIDGGVTLSGIDEFTFDKEFKFELMTIEGDEEIIENNQDNIETKYKYYLWCKDDGVSKNGIVTSKRNPMEITLSDVYGEFFIDDDSDSNYGLKNIREIDKENWISIINTEDDGNDVLKFSWLYSDNDVTLYGVDKYIYEGELLDNPFGENDAYVPEWNSDAIYHVIKKNVDKMYSFALQEHIYSDDENSTMRNYRPDGSVNIEGPYYKFDVENILYKVERGYKEFNHLNAEIVNLEHGKYYEYVRYINNIVNIKPLTWILLGFDYSRITGRIVNDSYPKWTLTLLGDEYSKDDDLKQDKIITSHCGLYFTYLFEYEGVYKIKLEILDINGNTYEIEKPIVIVDKDANYEMYHTLKDEYDKYLEAKNERNLINIY